MIDFRNVNTLWSSILVATLQNLGLTVAIICPGSRSTALTVALTQNSAIETIPILDERSAAFFALGIAKRTGKPTLLVCTSGTAGANFFPAVIEAKESHVPLIILTADRPPELRHCHAGQTIDQIKLYGNYPNWQIELALPQAKWSMLQYLRQQTITAWQKSLLPTPGVVHLNMPFREPLAPIPHAETLAMAAKFSATEFFGRVEAATCTIHSQSLPLESWSKYHRGIIIAGLAQPSEPEVYCLAIAKLSRCLGFPVLAEALSPVRNYAALNPYLISTYDSILREARLAQELIPEVVIQIGELPTSKQLRDWLRELTAPRWAIAPSFANFDPLHGRTTHLYLSIEQLIEEIPTENLAKNIADYCQKWCAAEGKHREQIDRQLESWIGLYEGKVAWLLSRLLPPETPIFLANSMSVRNAEFFWQPNNLQLIPYFNRGANGIDGTLSTALGIAHQHKHTVLLTGDLALLHDTNGWLIADRFVGNLTIVLINNHGGGIFELLPIAEFEPPFEEYFATSQKVDFEPLCQAYGIQYRSISNWQEFIDEIALSPNGIRVLELITDRKADARWLQKYLN
jgi:2-succinyl-5-enolpyruvyl-6-hydroxy-3-cyclohexene-1-carboxylate synthase